MFSNVLMTSLTPLCNTDESSCWENRPFTTFWPEEHQPMRTTRTVDQPKNPELKKTIKKKKRYRTAYNTEQLKVLEQTYNRIKYINKEDRLHLAETLKIGERSIKVWFQNRRMKEKKESSESSDSSTETISVDDFLASPLTTAPSRQEADVCLVSPNVELSNYNNMYTQVGGNQVYNNHFSNYSCQDLPNCNFCNHSESQSVAASMLPPPEPFADDRSTYPTSYYPTLVDYFCGQNYESGDVNSADMQWSANSFELNYM